MIVCCQWIEQTEWWFCEGKSGDISDHNEVSESRDPFLAKTSNEALRQGESQSVRVSQEARKWKKMSDAKSHIMYYLEGPCLHTP